MKHIYDLIMMIKCVLLFTVNIILFYLIKGRSVIFYIDTILNPKGLENLFIMILHKLIYYILNR